MYLLQNTVSGRFKYFHFYNAGPFLEAVINIAKPLLSRKFMERVC